MWPKRPASVDIDSATYLLMISSHDINNIAMSLYDIVLYKLVNIQTIAIPNMDLETAYIQYYNYKCISHSNELISYIGLTAAFRRWYISST